MRVIPQTNDRSSDSAPNERKPGQHHKSVIIDERPRRDGVPVKE
jgi:hypothetical protein